jgi:predicted DNA-binding protein (UPF0251 family)
MYFEEVIRETQDIGLNEIKVSGEEINVLRFVDYIAITAENQEDCQRPLNVLDQILQRYYMNINRTKTIMIVDGREKRNAEVTPRGEKLE